MRADERAQLETLLDRLALGDTSAAELGDDRSQRFAIERSLIALAAEGESLRRQKLEVRLRLAMHLSPAEALAYDRARAETREDLIADYLVNQLGRPRSGIDELAEDVARLLYLWEETRSQVTSDVVELRQRDGSRCRSCKVDLWASGPATSLSTRDPYKPYFLDPEIYLRAEVDHVDAISALGSNDLTNLQILCRLCNIGKLQGFGLSVIQEMQNAGRRVDNLSAQYRGTMLYYVLQRAGGKCSQCGANEAELTIRPVIPQGAYTRTNMTALCYACLTNRQKAV